MLGERRVVVTGLGGVTSLGNSIPETWSGILEGKSGVRRVSAFDVSQFSAQISSSVQNFDPARYIHPKEIKKMDTFVQFAIAAADEAVKDAGISVETTDPTRIGLSVGSGIGGLPTIEKNYAQLLEGGPRRLSPFFIPGAIINIASGQISIQHGFRGPNLAIVTACTTGAHNIGYAARTIVYGDADVMVAGGSEMATSPLGLGGFAALRALSTRNDEPEKASRPWDRDRDGFVLGDGAGVLVLEEYEHARKRGANILR